jgi:hypothetical protein
LLEDGVDEHPFRQGVVVEQPGLDLVGELQRCQRKQGREHEVAPEQVVQAQELGYASDAEHHPDCVNRGQEVVQRNAHLVVTARTTTTTTTTTTTKTTTRINKCIFFLREGFEWKIT